MPFGTPPHETVTRVVRPGQRYGFGGPTAGARVEVEPRHLGDPNVQRATMPPEEWEALEGRRAEKAAPKKGILAQMVERGQEAARREVLAAINRGRQHLARQQVSAAEEATAILDSSRRVEASDAERPTVARDVAPSFVPPRAAGLA
jgi:hypothetical protein